MCLSHPPASSRSFGQESRQVEAGPTLSQTHLLGARHHPSGRQPPRESPPCCQVRPAVQDTHGAAEAQRAERHASARQHAWPLSLRADLKTRCKEKQAGYSMSLRSACDGWNAGSQDTCMTGAAVMQEHQQPTNAALISDACKQGGRRKLPRATLDGVYCRGCSARKLDLCYYTPPVLL